MGERTNGTNAALPPLTAGAADSANNSGARADQLIAPLRSQTKQESVSEGELMSGSTGDHSGSGGGGSGGTGRGGRSAATQENGSNSSSSSKRKAKSNKPMLVESWLLDNFIACDRCSVPRQALFEQFDVFSQSKGCGPVSAAGFGKLIRATFPTIKTRRLGTRGNSKYHYYGIRLKPGSKVVLPEVEYTMRGNGRGGSAKPTPESAAAAMAAASASGSVSPAGSDTTNAKGSASQRAGSSAKSAGPYGSKVTGRKAAGPTATKAEPSDAAAFSSSIHPTKRRRGRGRPSAASLAAEAAAEATAAAAAFAVDSASFEFAAARTTDGRGGKNDSKRARTAGAPDRPAGSLHLPPGLTVPPDVDSGQVAKFLDAYHSHCSECVRLVKESGENNDLSELQRCIQNFWAKYSGEKWQPIFDVEDIAYLLSSIDRSAYEKMSKVLLPDLLHELTPTAAGKITEYTRNLENWLIKALAPYPLFFQRSKFETARTATISLFKEASLNHLAQAASATVFSDTAQVQTMLQDWRAIDFEYVQTQASFIVDCSSSIVNGIIKDVEHNLEQQLNLANWLRWIEKVISVLHGQFRVPFSQFYQTFFLRWSLYCNLIIRHLTIRNAPSFGAFHLLRTLFDDYVVFLSEKRLALEQPNVSVYDNFARSVSRNSTQKPQAGRRAADPGGFNHDKVFDNEEEEEEEDEFSSDLVSATNEEHVRFSGKHPSAAEAAESLRLISVSPYDRSLSATPTGRRSSSSSTTGNQPSRQQQYQMKPRSGSGTPKPPQLSSALARSPSPASMLGFRPIVDPMGAATSPVGAGRSAANGLPLTHTPLPYGFAASPSGGVLFGSSSATPLSFRGTAPHGSFSPAKLSNTPGPGPAASTAASAAAPRVRRPGAVAAAGPPAKARKTELTGSGAFTAPSGGRITRSSSSLSRPSSAIDNSMSVTPIPLGTATNFDRRSPGAFAFSPAPGELFAAMPDLTSGRRSITRMLSETPEMN